MYRAPLIALIFALAACDINVEKMVDRMAGREESVVVLLDQPTTLGPSVRTLTPGAEPMKVLGERSSLCLSLRGDIPLQDTKTMDAIFAEAMGKAKVKVELILDNGARVTLRQPLQAWSMFGQILKRDELAACAGTPCKAELPIGAQVSKVEVSADVPLAIQGMYWQSESDTPKRSSPNAPSIGAPASPSSSTQQ